MSGVSRRQRLRLGLSFALAEGLMPLVGFLLGKAIAAVVGEIASYAAILLLFGIGLYAIWEASHETEQEFDDVNWYRLLVMSLSVSLDELAIGLSLGLLGVPVLLAVILIAGQAFLVTLIGTAIGRKVGELAAERAGLLSGVVLCLLALFLFAEKLMGKS
jgi:manganese efflux pump family protein